MSLVAVQDIIETGGQASLTNTVLAEWAENRAPRNSVSICTGCSSPSTNPGKPHAANGC